jgi:adenylate kinase family enzyme
VLLGPDDTLDYTPRRIVVNGGPGAGKSTVASAISSRLGLPYTEIDSLYHGSGWSPRDTFVEDVRAIAAADGWVSEWQYDATRPVLLARCDLMVWLDVPRLVTTWRVTRRTLRRRFRREQLWNGNREGPLWRIVSDPEHIIRWAWTAHPRAAERSRQVLRDRPELPIVRLSTAPEVERWLTTLNVSGGTPGPPR